MRSSTYPIVEVARAQLKQMETPATTASTEVWEEISKEDFHIFSNIPVTRKEVTFIYEGGEIAM